MIEQKKPRLFRAISIFLFISSFVGIVAGFMPLAKSVPAKRFDLGHEERVFREMAVFPLANDYLKAKRLFIWPRPGVPPDIRTYGSWIDKSDHFQGKQITDWHEASRTRIAVMVAGYPKTPNELTIEVRHKNGSRSEIQYEEENPGESWMPWIIELPADASSFRINASDNSSARFGWLGFTEPFYHRPMFAFLHAWVRIVGAFCLAFLLIIGPGVVLQNLLCRKDKRTCVACWMLPGPFLLAVLGGLCYFWSDALSPNYLALTLISPILIALAIFAVTVDWMPTVLSHEKLLLSLMLLTVAFGIGKSTYSGGPKGELLEGTISRTLEVGDRPDSRISYHVVQVIANHLHPGSVESIRLFMPYSFYSRGPLAGFIAAPIVLALGGAPPSASPNQYWMPFDPEGFMTYRIVLMILASLTLVPIWAVLHSTAGENAAVLGITWLTLSPFFLHEVYFTWPKMSAAAFCFLAFYEAFMRRRYFFAGLVHGLSSLLHPLTLLAAPFMWLWIIGERLSGQSNHIQHSSSKHGIRKSIIYCTGVAVIFISWSMIGGFGSSGFFEYFLGAESSPTASMSSWMMSRWRSFANTLIPGYLFMYHATNPSVNTIYGGVSDEWIRFFFQYWTTFPFGFGIFLFVASLPFWTLAIRSYTIVALGCVMLPFLFLCAYWGGAITGLMREGGHVWFLSAIAFLAYATAGSSSTLQQYLLRIMRHPLFLGLRAIEVFLMAFAMTLFHVPLWESGIFACNNIMSLSLATSSLLAIITIICRFKTENSGNPSN